MWGALTILLLVTAVSADYEHAWKPGKEYHYVVRSRTFTGLDTLTTQYSGIVIKALLTIQPQDTQTLRAKVSNCQYANIHKVIDNWEAPISDEMLELRELPMSGKPFEIKMKHGVIRDLITDRDVPTWEVNMLKGIVSQLQVDTQGENAMRSRSTQVPDNEQPFGMFKAMEDSVGGKCEVIYDITPLPESVLQRKPELVPLPNLKKDGEHIDIIKTKNYSRCDQRMSYHSGITGKTNWEPGSNKNGQFLTKSTNSRIIITGNLKSFTIQSSMTTNKMFVSPRLSDDHAAIVVSRMNLSLANVRDVTDKMSSPKNPESTGNLVYTFNNPFSEDELRKPGRPTIAENSKASDSSSQNSVSSSEEAGRRGHHNHGSGSSSDSSSSISSSEEGNFWQPKPTLEDAPQNPLLPFFIGNKGKAIGMSDKVDVVKDAKELVSQISMEMEDPNNMPEKQTLEKFTILTNLLRTMSRKEMREMESVMHLTPNELNRNDQSDPMKQNAWGVFRDAITQCGTGPALLTIKDWIENKKVKPLEGSQIVSRLSKTALTPTSEYVDALFELVKNPVVKKEKGLNSTVVLAFADLVRQSQVSNSTLHNRYPVHVFGRMVSKHSQAVEKEYIPYLANELKEAIKDGDSPRIQTYILALGSIGHPKILTVLEPYLEGKEKVSTFQRTMMVAALSKLAELKPNLARSVLYKIYLNTMESHEVRCTAVYLIMKTNPPLTMLQRMAEFTNIDTSKHVNSAVKTTLENIAKLKQPETSDLANKARIAASSLNLQDYDSHYSSSYMKDSASLNELDLAYRLIVNYIGSDDSIIPRAWYIGMDTTYGEFKAPTVEVEAMVSSVQSLVDMYFKKTNKEERKEKTQTEKIAEILNIEPEDPIQIEGHLLMKNKFSTQFWPFDNHTLEAIPRLAAECMSSMSQGGNFNLNKLLNFELTLSFPTETGLPFIYNLNIPLLAKISGNGKLQGNNEGGSLKAEVDFVHSMKVQGRAGFITPFDHHQYSSGVDINIQSNIPIKMEAELEIPKKHFDLKVWPLKARERTRLIHYSLVPYTSVHDILNLRPVITDKQTQKIHVTEPKSKTQSYPVEGTPMITVRKSADDLEEPVTLGDDTDILAVFVFPWSRNNNKFREYDVFVRFEENQIKDPVRFHISGEYMRTSDEPDDSDVSNEKWDTKALSIDRSDKEADSQKRKMQFLKEAADGIQSGDAYVVDVRLDTPGELRTRNALTVAWAKSNSNDKTRTLLFWQFKLPDANMNFEVCGAARSKSTPNIFMDWKSAMKTMPKTNYDVDIRFGESCLKGKQIELKGESTQTEKFRKNLVKQTIVKKCEEQMEEGNKALRACQHAIDLARTENYIDLSIDLQSLPSSSNSMVVKAVDYTRELKSVNDGIIYKYVDPENADKKKIDLKLEMSDDLSAAKMSLHTPMVDITFPEVELEDMTVKKTNMLNTNDDDDIRTTPVDVTKGICVLDNNQAETFDGRAYPLKLGKCWHVAMTTYPKKNPGKSNEPVPILEKMRVSVLTRETEEGKEVKINLGEKEVRLGSSGSKLKVTVNKQKVPLSKDSTYKLKNDKDEVELEIFELPNGLVDLISKKHQFEAVFDGKRIQIKAGFQFENSVRGLCGNFDGEPDNDFISPKSCVMKKPEDFLASYALVKDECQGPSLENARRLEKADCAWHTIRMSNVINDYEAGRVSGARKNWGYHAEDHKDEKHCNTYRTKVVEHDDKICFSTRPVPACAENCRSVETKEKNLQFYCMKRNDAALEMQKRVEKGANPDLSQKPANYRKTIDVPLECQA